MLKQFYRSTKRERKAENMRANNWSQYHLSVIFVGGGKFQKINNWIVARAVKL